MDYTIIIDYQKDFIDGSLYNKEAIEIRDNVIKRINEGIKKNHKIIFTRDTHDTNYLSSSEGKKLPVVHCVKNTEGWMIDSKVSEFVKDIDYKIIDKPTFGYKDWALENPENIYVLGVCTDICVISNVLILKALYPNANIYVYKDAVAGLTKEKNLYALSVMESCQVNII